MHTNTARNDSHARLVLASAFVTPTPRCLGNLPDYFPAIDLVRRLVTPIAVEVVLFMLLCAFIHNERVGQSDR